jgi:broad specificity phosphatase PhoE
MQFILIRHGKPFEDSVRWPSDPPLCPLGEQQAECTAARLAREGITRIVASPMKRAYATAQPLAEKTGLPIQVVEGIAEVDNSNGARYISVETLKADPPRWRAFLADPIRFLGGDPETFQRSILNSFSTLIQDGHGQKPGQKVAIFTHGLPINILLAHVLGLSSITNFIPRYGSITRLGGRDIRSMLVFSINETTHFDPGEGQ